MAAIPPQDLSFADTAPARPEATAVVDGTPEEVWAVLADHRAWPTWFGPSLVEVTPTSDPASGVGSTRTVRVKGGATVQERFIAWDEPHLWAFTGVDFKPGAFRKLVERATIEPAGDGRTRITYRMAFAPHPLLRPLLPLIRRQIAANLTRAMAGLADEVVRRRRA